LSCRKSCRKSCCKKIWPISVARMESDVQFGATVKRRRTMHYSSILREIASRFQNFASRGEVAPRERVAIPIQSQLHACCQVETRRDATWRERIAKFPGSVISELMVLVFRLPTALLDHQPVTLHLSPVRCRPKRRGSRSGISPHVPESCVDLNKIKRHVQTRLRT
jgi:hypothetical protein